MLLHATTTAALLLLHCPSATQFWSFRVILGAISQHSPRTLPVARSTRSPSSTLSLPPLQLPPLPPPPSPPPSPSLRRWLQAQSWPWPLHAPSPLPSRRRWAPRRLRRWRRARRHRQGSAPRSRSPFPRPRSPSSRPRSPSSRPRSPSSRLPVHKPHKPRRPRRQ